MSVLSALNEKAPKMHHHFWTAVLGLGLVRIYCISRVSSFPHHKEGPATNCKLPCDHSSTWSESTGRWTWTFSCLAMLKRVDKMIWVWSVPKLPDKPHAPWCRFWLPQSTRTAQEIAWKLPQVQRRGLGSARKLWDRSLQPMDSLGWKQTSLQNEYYLVSVSLCAATECISYSTPRHISVYACGLGFRV